VGNRNAEDMVSTLVPEKKAVVIPVRNALLGRGYTEEVEYDYINVEPVLVYSKSETNVVFVRHKWEILATVPLHASNEKETQLVKEFSSFLSKDEEGKIQLRFKLPDQENELFEASDLLSKSGS
jgi:hypothetical protein